MRETATSGKFRLRSDCMHQVIILDYNHRRCQKLTILDLSKCLLESVSPAIGLLSQLRKVYLSGNNIPNLPPTLVR